MTASRDWCDYGKDTGPRLRIKGIYEGEEAAKRVPYVAPPQTSDPGDDAEAHQAYVKAKADGDERALAKVFPDLLDEIHSSGLGERKTDDAAIAAYEALQQCVENELREVGRSDPKWAWAYALLDDGFAIRGKTPEGFELACLLDKKALRARIVGAAIDPRASAYTLVSKAVGEIRKTRQTMLSASS